MILIADGRPDTCDRRPATGEEEAMHIIPSLFPAADEIWLSAPGSSLKRDMPGKNWIYELQWIVRFHVARKELRFKKDEWEFQIISLP